MCIAKVHLSADALREGTAEFCLSVRRSCGIYQRAETCGISPEYPEPDEMMHNRERRQNPLRAPFEIALAAMDARGYRGTISMQRERKCRSIPWA